jgi:hypothetical protein
LSSQGQEPKDNSELAELLDAQLGDDGGKTGYFLISGLLPGPGIQLDLAHHVMDPINDRFKAEHKLEVLVVTTSGLRARFKNTHWFPD